MHIEEILRLARKINQFRGRSCGDRVYIRPGKISANEINIRFTMAKAGLYSVWIKTLPNDRMDFDEAG